MSKVRKPKRTKVSRLAVGQKELTKQESKKIKGGLSHGSNGEQVVVAFLGSAEYLGR
jgi:hypothetical protein